MRQLGRRGTITILLVASMLSFGHVSSAVAQPSSGKAEQSAKSETHCAAEAAPINDPASQGNPVCFGTELEAEQYIQGLDPQNSSMRAAAASTILGTVYQDTNRNGSSLTLWGTNGCAGSVFGFSSLESGWNKSISSATGQNGCWVTLYTAVNYGGATLNCTPYCASISTWNDNVKSLVFRPTGTFG